MAAKGKMATDVGGMVKARDACEMAEAKVEASASAAAAAMAAETSIRRTQS